MKYTTHLAVFAAFSIATAACTGQSNANSTAPTAPTPPASITAPAATVTNVTLSGSAAVGSFQLVAMAQRSDNTSENATTTALWTSSNPGVARVAAGGWVTVASDGDVEFAATYQGVTGTLRATVSVPKTYKISGVVTDAATKAPLANVDVQVLESGSRTTTDASGKYALVNVTSGRMLVEFSSTGYDVNEKDVTIDADTTLSVALSASESPQ
ncbi:MAG TPA: carboxypeptidase-like regulatory domain-containing protein [Vicinamibacterales bacterium]|jgi:hypothetical protein|nr:carboxypeptidase-like regulatory domain-containing protein [Vicinamibacterales bacterium]